jgi:hypothetical protein
MLIALFLKYLFKMDSKLGINIKDKYSIILLNQILFLK